MNLLKTFVLFWFTALPIVTFAGPPIEVDLPPIEHLSAKLTVFQSDGTFVDYSPSELEQFPTYQLVTVTPWREEAAMFQGVMLIDILQANGLVDESSVKITAENDYSIEMPMELWTTVPVLVATRVDGKPLSRRDRGPILFVIDEEDYKASEIAREHHLVWMVATIEAKELN